MTEERHEDPFVTGSVLVQEDPDESASGECAEHGSDGVTFVDHFDSRPFPEPGSERVQPPGVEWAGDDGQRIAGKPVSNAEKLPVSQVSSQDQRPPVRSHDGLEVLDAIHRDRPQRPLQGMGEHGGEFDHHHPQVMVRALAESAPVPR